MVPLRAYPEHRNKGSQSSWRLESWRSLYCSLDEGGAFGIDNVDVGGIAANSIDDLRFLLAVLNSPIANYVFRRLSKPFQNDYRSANKQFIEPLPIPKVSGDARAEIVALSDRLTGTYTQIDGAYNRIRERLALCTKRRKSEDWLNPLVPSLYALRRQSPRNLSSTERNEWARKQRASVLSDWKTRLKTELGIDFKAEAVSRDGAVEVCSGERRVEISIFPGEADLDFVLTQTRLAMRDLAKQDALSVDKLVDRLRYVYETDNVELKRLIVADGKVLDELLAEARASESELNETLFRAYEIDEPAVRAQIMDDTSVEFTPDLETQQVDEVDEQLVIAD